MDIKNYRLPVFATSSMDSIEVPSPIEIKEHMFLAAIRYYDDGTWQRSLTTFRYLVKHRLRQIWEKFINPDLICIENTINIRILGSVFLKSKKSPLVAFHQHGTLNYVRTISLPPETEIWYQAAPTNYMHMAMSRLLIPTIKVR